MTPCDKQKLIDNYMSNIVNFFVDNGVFSACLSSSIVLIECLQKHNMQAKLAQRFLVMENYAVTHFIVELDGKIIDLGTKITQRLNSTIDTSKFWLTTDIDGMCLDRLDQETDTDKKQHNELLYCYNTYQKNPKKYWKSAPRRLREFRDKIIV
jgi:hypothetical protein